MSPNVIVPSPAYFSDEHSLGRFVVTAFRSGVGISTSKILLSRASSAYFVGDEASERMGSWYAGSDIDGSYGSNGVGNGESGGVTGSNAVFC